MSRPDNPRFPHYCTIVRVSNAGPLVDDGEETVIYEGSCRVYDKNTTSDRGEVITSNRGLSLPFALKDWESVGFMPLEGDQITVSRGNITEHGVVIDKNPSNFGGTHLVWNYDRE